MLAGGKEKESEPEGGTFHEEPSQRWRDGRTPTRAVVLAVRGLEEVKADPCW